ncbi:MAG: septum formation initiator family protein [Armatimonadota bacterium]|nr:septum formation initiator family protein [Armatimonadota bacterium]MDR7444447.1 septum formation initiator family protein [Armatimonadota bacterium]MDR7570149.1 septum formation initiator family protein [Armatimonadota bacterium]MDR7615248.1 septum formation initiator family protein [Armatimonadota bacterium]
MHEKFPITEMRPRRTLHRTPPLPRFGKLLVLLTLMAFLTGSLARSASRAYWLDREVRTLEHVRASLLAQNRRLREEIHRLHDPKVVERIAREELGFVRPGEIAVLLLPDPGPPPRRSR